MCMQSYNNRKAIPIFSLFYCGAVLALAGPYGVASSLCLRLFRMAGSQPCGSGFNFVLLAYWHDKAAKRINKTEKMAANFAKWQKNNIFAR